MIKIAIDGPSGAGKSTLAKHLAKELGFLYADTGAMYRAVGLYVLEAGKDTQNADEVTPLLPLIRMEARPLNGGQQTLLNGRDVSAEIRREEVGMAASNVSKQPAVRAFLLDTQRKIALANNTIMDGRDIGTVVLPDADLKIFLTAAPEMRALRRYEELKAKGESAAYEKVLADVIARDKQDTERKEAPLRQAEDAVLLNTTYLDLEESYQRLRDIVLQHAGV